ncbi:hypothetical protein F5Y08DRAFT_321163 [Xylaria arbuscula]|nr:hypothetical protein F5Y08DRAFT_321163 [Xylaria arbuscula]
MHPSSFIAFLAVSVSALPASQPLDRRAGGLLGLVDNLLGNLLGGNLLGSLLGNDASGDNPLGGLLDGDLLGDLLGGDLLGGKDSEKETPDAPPSDLVCGTSSCLNKCTQTCQGGVQKVSEVPLQPLLV